MAQWFADFFKNDYGALEIFLWVLVVWVFASVSLALSSFKFRNKTPEPNIISSLREKIDISGFGALVLTALLIPLDAYVTNFGDSQMSSDPAVWGQMGDFFGGMLNPVLAFASFIALLYTIRIQTSTQHEMVESAKSDRRLSFLVTEYHRMVNSIEKDLDNLDYKIVNKIPVRDGQLDCIFRMVLSGSGALYKKFNKSVALSEIEHFMLDFKDSNSEAILIISTYMIAVAKLKHTVQKMALQYEELCKLAEIPDIYAEGWERVSTHLVIAEVLQSVVTYSNLHNYGGFLCNLPGFLVTEVERLADQSFHLLVDTQPT